MVSTLIDVVQLFGDSPRISNAPVRDSAAQQLINILRAEETLMFHPAIGWMAWSCSRDGRQTSRPARRCRSSCYAYIFNAQRTSESVQANRVTTEETKNQFAQLDFDTDLVPQVFDQAPGNPAHKRWSRL